MAKKKVVKKKTGGLFWVDQEVRMECGDSLCETCKGIPEEIYIGKLRKGSDLEVCSKLFMPCVKGKLKKGKDGEIVEQRVRITIEAV